MQQVKSANTAPELLVRRLLHRMGYRYRLHSRKLPGKPDIVFGTRRKAVLIHGCFWHLHNDPACARARVPKARSDYWRPKLERNRARDAVNESSLKQLGWDVLVLWECQLKDVETLAATLREFLGPPGRAEKKRLEREQIVN